MNRLGRCGQVRADVGWLGMGLPSPLPWVIPSSPRSASIDPLYKALTFPDSPLPAAPFSISPFLLSLIKPVVSLLSFQALRQPLGIGPLIRHMNKSQRLLKRRAVLSAVIKWCVSAEQGAIKTVWEKEGKVQAAL